MCTKRKDARARARSVHSFYIIIHTVAVNLVYGHMDLVLLAHYLASIICWAHI